MNSKLLLNHTVNIPSQHISFLKYIHPHFDVVDNLATYGNPRPEGIIYTGSINKDTKAKLQALTQQWIIVSSKEFDLDLTTNENLLKHLLPLHYIKLKKQHKKKEDIAVYNTISYEALLEQIKLCLVDSTRQIEAVNSTETSVYILFAAILSTPANLDQVYFNLVDSSNIAVVTSSILSFLVKVQSQNITGASANYSRLIIQSYKRYGKYIKPAITKFISSKANKEIALYNLLTYLNKAR